MIKEGKVKKPFYKRWWFILLVIFVIIGAIGSGGDDEITSADTENLNSQVNQEEAVEEEKELERSDMNIDEYLAFMINEVMGEETNMEETTIVSVSNGDEGIKDITLRANDNFSNKMIVGGMLMDATEFFKKISKDQEVLELKAVSLIYEMTLVDKYGNEDDYPVHIITLNIDTMNKINWNNFFSDNIPSIADTYFLHPVLKD